MKEDSIHTFGELGIFSRGCVSHRPSGLGRAQLLSSPLSLLVFASGHINTAKHFLFWDDRWGILKLYPQENDFWSPDGGSNQQSSDNRWDALTIELPRHRCGFDPRLGLRNHLSENRAWRSFIYHLKISLSSHTSKNFNIFCFLNIYFNLSTITNISNSCTGKLFCIPFAFHLFHRFLSLPVLTTFVATRTRINTAPEEHPMTPD